MIVGIDEVGRGAWAGPLCVAAVGLGGSQIEGLTDSKKLSKKKREIYSTLIKQEAPLIGIGWVSAAVIDQIGMSQALKLATERAFVQIDSKDITQIIIDGTIQLLDDPRATTMKQADLIVPSVSAASIIAKVARDIYMKNISHIFTNYSFHDHVGYGTSKHQNMISEYGTTAIHRMTFSPMKTLDSAVSQQVVNNGSVAETKAAIYMKNMGYQILEKNWKTKWCEIDIIAKKDSTIFFVEVKYRKKSTWGTGLDAITKKKYRQMKFAAEIWLSSHTYQEARLATISLSGDDFVVDSFLDNIM